MKKIRRLFRFEWNWQGTIVGLGLLGLLAGDLALLGRTVSGYVGIAVLVIVAAVALRAEIGPRWLHR